MHETNHPRASFPRLQMLHVVADLIDELTMHRARAEFSLVVGRLLNVRQHKSIEIHGNVIAVQWQLISLRTARVVDVSALLLVVVFDIGRVQGRHLT